MYKSKNTDTNNIKYFVTLDNYQNEGIYKTIPTR